jgi:two-component system, NarL family, response regulator DevR
MSAIVKRVKSNQTSIRVLIVDDHEMIRTGLGAILACEKDLCVVGEAETLAEALMLVERQCPDIVLLDARLPDGSGPEACRRFLAIAPQLRIVILTIYAEEEVVATAIRNGAHGFILKDVRADVLTRAIRAVAGGQSYLDPKITRVTLGWIKARQLSPGKSQGMTQLSLQEQVVIAVLAEGKTNKEIADQLQLSDKTIKNYLVNIFSKLDIKRRTEAVAWYINQVHSEE